MNEIVNEIEIQERQKPAAGEIFTTSVTVANIQLMKSWAKVKYRELRMSVAGEIFYNICHSRRQIMNGILNEIKMQGWRKPATGEIF